MHDPSQNLFQLTTSMVNLIKKNLSGTLASSLKPSSNCGWKKICPRCLSSAGTGDPLHLGSAGRAQVGGSGSHTEQLWDSPRVGESWRKPSILISVSILSIYCME